ncbi:MAG TPA: succinate dehydrogenase, hydrophobic membrane anchor protein [Roseomonas sp.]|jgi:succinate dehydrogenase / fumarate reductase membrane anchor subunit
MANPTMERGTLRSPLGRVRGLGSARSGTQAWWMQRVTSIALLPLTIWLIFSLASLAGSDFLPARAWAARPLNAALLLAFLAAAFHHSSAGIREVIEDYVKPEYARMGAILAVKGLCALLWLIASLAVLRIAV